MEGIQSVLDERGSATTVTAGFLDAQRFPQKEILRQASDLMEARIRAVNPDVIITCDNVALSFALERRARGFPHVPIVFCGLNDFTPSMIAGYDLVTGVCEDMSVEDTMRAAIRLQPGTRRLIVYGGTRTYASSTNHRAVEREIQGLRNEIAIELWDDLSLEETRRRVGALKRGDVLFLNGGVMDTDGAEMLPAGSAEYMRTISNVPLYSFWDASMGHGIVGGKLSSGRSQGESAARLVQRILDGEDPGALPVVSARESNRFIFDMRELKRFHIPRAALPEGSLVSYDTESPLRTYRWYVGGAVLFLLLESLVILYLIWSIRLRRRTQRRLEEEQAQLGLALDGARMGMWEWGAAMDRFHCDERACAMLGFAPGEMDTDKAGSILLAHPDDRKKLRATIDACMAGKAQILESEHRMIGKSGESRWMWQRGLVVERDAKGNPLRLWGTLLDITERKYNEEQRIELERRLLHSQKLESMGVLAGGIAHDFNNLLTAILGNLDLVQMSLPESSDARACMDAALAATNRAADLTRQMLAYSGKGRFLVREIDVSGLVQEFAHLLRTSIARTATLSLRLARDLPAILADSAQVQQVIMNLITNASEAIGEKAGAITVSTGMQHCTEEYLAHSRLERKPRPGSFVWIQVADTGCGMSQEVQARLFEPFFTSKVTGRGLGMSAVLGIVSGHDGAIIVYSEAGVGTSIKVLFPALAQAAAETAPAVRTDLREQAMKLSGRVLVVDDEDAVRLLAQRMLERMGLDVVAMSDSGEALKAFRVSPDDFAFILLDLTMPKMDGATLFMEMKKIAPDARIILSSGYNQQEVTQRFEGKGLTGFVQKPYVLAELRTEVLRVMSAARERPDAPR